MPRFENIRAVTFDAGGTLLETWPSVGHLYAQVAAEHGCAGLDAERLNRSFAAAWKTKGPFDYSEDAWRRLVEATFAGLVEAAEVRRFFAPLYERFEQPSAWRVYDDVMPALRQLGARGLTLAVISNWDSRLRPLLTRLGLAPRFQGIFISAEIGHHKPAPEIFQVAAVRLGLPQAAILHVGDGEHEDVAAARAAGFAAVRIDRRGPAVSGGVIRSLTTIDSLI
jgi:putative hydrolase of the HAD superfamily